MAQRGGKRTGAGRKPGKANRSTLEKLAVRREMDQRVLATANRLFEAQYVLAVGAVSVFRVVTNAKTGKRTHHLATDDDEITALLDEAVSEEDGSDNDSVVVVQKIKPDLRAIDSLFDRVFGKPKPLEENEEDIDKLKTAKMFAVFYEALKDPTRPPVLQVEEAIEGYCRLKGLDPVELAEMVQQEVLEMERRDQLED